MITGSFIMISEGEIKERRKKRETELRKMVYEEYENFKIYISFYELPEIKKITFMNMRGCDAAVSPIFSSELEIRINEKYLKAKCPMEYLKVILFHEFTHIWDRIVKYADLRAAKLTEYHAKNIVVDPVMVATSGARLISEDAISTLKSKLLPLATVITPNIPEAEVLSEMQIKTDADMEKAAEIICDTLGCAVLLKGGHQLNDANDLLYQKGKEPVWFEGKRIDNPNTHGTGCTLSSAIASNLAKGRDLETSVKYAKNYISGALAAMLDLGKGSGPMDHAFAIEGEY